MKGGTLISIRTLVLFDLEVDHIAHDNTRGGRAYNISLILDMIHIAGACARARVSELS